MSGHDTSKTEGHSPGINGQGCPQLEDIWEYLPQRPAGGYVPLDRGLGSSRASLELVWSTRFQRTELSLNLLSGGHGMLIASLASTEM